MSDRNDNLLDDNGNLLGGDENLLGAVSKGGSANSNGGSTSGSGSTGSGSTGSGSTKGGGAGNGSGSNSGGGSTGGGSTIVPWACNSSYVEDENAEDQTTLSGVDSDGNSFTDQDDSIVDGSLAFEFMHRYINSTPMTYSIKQGVYKDANGRMVEVQSIGNDTYEYKFDKNEDGVIDSSDPVVNIYHDGQGAGFEIDINDMQYLNDGEVEPISVPFVVITPQGTLSSNVGTVTVNVVGKNGATNNGGNNGGGNNGNNDQAPVFGVYEVAYCDDEDSVRDSGLTICRRIHGFILNSRIPISRS